MTTLIIHMGAHKTASTLLQQRLAKQSDALHAQGVNFQAKESYALGGELMHHSPLSLQRLTELSALLHTSEHDKILWSCEGFMGDFYQHYANQEPLLSDLATITKGVEVVWVLYVRRQDTFIESLYQQMMKEGRAPSWSDYYASIAHHPYDWNCICEHIAAHFPQSDYHVFPYEMIEEDSGASIQALAEVMGVRLDVQATGVINPSLSPLGMRLGALTPYVPSGKLRYAYRRLLQAGFPKRRAHALLSDHERAQLLDAYKQSNQQLFERWVRDERWRAWRDYYMGES